MSDRSIDIPPHTVYVVGFLLDDRDRVVLVRKNRPRWQSGFLNGVGGKVEAGETPADAVRREFEEEAGLDIDTWEQFAELSFHSGVVHFFRANVAPGTLESVTSCTDEPIEVHVLTAVLAPGVKIIGNLRWLLPLAACRDRYADIVRITEVAPGT